MNNTENATITFVVAPDDEWEEWGDLLSETFDSELEPALVDGDYLTLIPGLGYYGRQPGHYEREW